jgi:hypothetical protein
MIVKVRKSVPLGGKILGSLIIFEAVAFGASYFFYRKTNSDRGKLIKYLHFICKKKWLIFADFRHQLKQKYPYLLEKYYQMGELVSNDNLRIRQMDEKIWAMATPKEE